MVDYKLRRKEYTLLVELEYLQLAYLDFFEEELSDILE